MDIVNHKWQQAGNAPGAAGQENWWRIAGGGVAEVMWRIVWDTPLAVQHPGQRTAHQGQRANGGQRGGEGGQGGHAAAARPRCVVPASCRAATGRLTLHWSTSSRAQLSQLPQQVATPNSS